MHEIRWQNKKIIKNGKIEMITKQNPTISRRRLKSGYYSFF